MHVPDHFALTEPSRVRDIIDRFDFAVLVTALDGRIEATHLPFMYDAQRGPHGTLMAHMARANRQWRDFAGLAAAGQDVLVVFQGPHAYISPTWYGTEKPAVPTWNYAAVHAYGTPRILDSAGDVRALLERLTERQEANLDPPWRLDSQATDYVDAMMRGIVAFEIPVARLEAKAKFNQNRTPAQIAGAAAGLEATAGAQARETADWMRALAPREVT